MEDKLVTLKQCDTLFEAEFAKDLLLENNIKAMVVGDQLHNVSYLSEATIVQVKVFECDLEKAKDILEQQTADDSEEN